MLHILEHFISGRLKLPQGYTLHSVERGREEELLLLLSCHSGTNTSGSIITLFDEVFSGRLELPRGYKLRSLEVSEDGKILMTLSCPSEVIDTTSSPIITFLGSIIRGHLVLPDDYTVWSAELGTESEVLWLHVRPVSLRTTDTTSTSPIISVLQDTISGRLVLSDEFNLRSVELSN